MRSRAAKATSPASTDVEIRCRRVKAIIVPVPQVRRTLGGASRTNKGFARAADAGCRRIGRSPPVWREFRLTAALADATLAIAAAMRWPIAGIDGAQWRPHARPPGLARLRRNDRFQRRHEGPPASTPAPTASAPAPSASVNIARTSGGTTFAMPQIVPGPALGHRAADIGLVADDDRKVRRRRAEGAEALEHAAAVLHPGHASSPKRWRSRPATSGGTGTPDTCGMLYSVARSRLSATPSMMAAKASSIPCASTSR